MSTPDKRNSGAISPRNHKAPVFRTASGNVVEAKPNQPVAIDDVLRQVDVCWVVDTTGSMSDKINGLTQCMVDFVAELAKLKLDWRSTAVPFGDLTVPGDRVVGDLPFVSDRQAAEQMIRNLPHFNGGGNTGESSLEAMQAAMSKRYRQGAVSVLVLLTDEPPLTGPQLNAGTITRALQQQELICFVASPPHQGYEPWAEKNAGKWYPIGSHMDTSDLLAFLKGLLKDVARISKAVHELGGGSVRRYIAEAKRRELEG